MKFKKHSPEILLVTGIVGIVGTVVLACCETKKAEEIIAEAHEELDKIEYKVLPKKKDYFKVYVKTGARLARTYAPAVIIGSASIGCIVGSHCILNKRYLGTVAAYSLLDESFKNYRTNVKKRFGEEVERKIYLGLDDDEETKEDISSNKEDKAKNNTDECCILSPTKGVIANPKLNCSPYARFFDESCGAWQKNSEFNKLTLQTLQHYANDIFNARGHLFLNEVYDMLGMERSQAGSVVGWIKGAGDDYIDFHIYDPSSEPARDFINGYERSILLDFNVDGVIWDKI